MHKGHKCEAIVPLVHAIILHMYHIAKRHRGFTLVEIIVVVGIIGMLSSVVMFSVSQARENARDKTRVVDIEQLHLTFKLYREGFNDYPKDTPPSTLYDDGVEIGRGTAIDDDLKVLQPSLPKDPKSGDTGYGYFYDTDFKCTKADEKVLYVQGFESLESQANADDVCGSDVGDDAESGMYIILLE